MRSAKNGNRAAISSMSDRTARLSLRQNVPTRRFSRTVRPPKMPRPSGTIDRPILQIASGSRPRIERPSKRISPFRTGRLPAVANIVEDLPAPFGPTIDAASPSPISTEIPRTAASRP
jgi:hypothetical protein